ncbi:MAG: glycosyltransferase family 4 protein [Candidatus Omnitrophica bacterium]|nr:glycosyltransferase family 4 protein [Candidatus Omnitrophota bacterium]
MKILVITNLYPNKFEPTKGVYNKQMVNELSKLCELKVVAPVPWVPAPRIIEKLLFYNNITEKEIIDGIEVFHPRNFILPKIGRVMYGVYFYLSLYGKIKKIHESFKFDIILALWVFPDGVGSYYIAKKLKVPIIVEALGSDINIYTKYFLRRKIISSILNKCDRVIAVSTKLKDTMASIGVHSEKVSVISNGVNSLAFNRIDKRKAREILKLSVGSKIILFVGNLVPVKGVNFLLDAYKMVASNDKNVQLILVGDGFLKQSLVKKAKDYNIEVNFCGKVSHSDVSLWMNACDVLCLPSLNEGCPNVILEAMACGSRIVASCVGGIPEMVSSYSRVELVKPKDVKQLAKALTSAVTNEKNIEEIKNVINNRSWHDAAQEILFECNKVKDKFKEINQDKDIPATDFKKNKIKVLAITNLFPSSKEPTRGIFNKQQFLELAKLCDLKVVAPLPWHIKIDVPRREKIDGIKTYHPRYIMTPLIGRSLYGVFFYLSLCGFMKNLHKEFPFDVILSTWAYPDAFGSYLIAKMLKKPIAIKVHGSDINAYSAYFLRRKMIRWALSNCDKVIAVSNGLKEAMIKIGVPQEKIDVIPNGVDSNLFKPMDIGECRKKLNLPINSKIILYLGNFVSGKKLDVLIDAFYALSRLDKDILLLLVGDGTMRNVLREKVNKLRIAHCVVFAGRQLHSKMNLYINACNVLCLPSMSEGCPNVILESWACGKPVVATKVKGITELFISNERGILVEPDNVESLVRGLSQALMLDWDCVFLKEQVLCNSWGDNAKSLFKILQDIGINEN